jgi:hypothetical protein
MKYIEKRVDKHFVGEVAEEHSATVELEELNVDSEFLLNWARERIDGVVISEEEMPKDIKKMTAAEKKESYERMKQELIAEFESDDPQ